MMHKKEEIAEECSIEQELQRQGNNTIAGQEDPCTLHVFWVFLCGHVSLSTWMCVSNLEALYIQWC